jgi:hypothetical protein
VWTRGQWFALRGGHGVGASCRRGQAVSPQTTLAAAGYRGYAYRVRILDAVRRERLYCNSGEGVAVRLLTATVGAHVLGVGAPAEVGDVETRLYQ